MEMWVVTDEMDDGKEKVKGVYLSYSDASDNQKPGQQLHKIVVRPTEVEEFVFNDVGGGALKITFEHQVSWIKGGSSE